MVFFNDPVAVESHELQAIQLALATHDRFAELAGTWRKRGTELDLGIGIEAGYATLGRIGFEGRYDYGALGSVTNLASRLSDSAAAGQILIGQRVFAAVDEAVETVAVGDLELKGFARPVAAYEFAGCARSWIRSRLRAAGRRPGRPPGRGRTSTRSQRCTPTTPPYRALAFRAPDTATGYLQRVFAEESDIACRFGEPVVSGRPRGRRVVGELDRGRCSRSRWRARRCCASTTRARSSTSATTGIRRRAASSPYPGW